MRKVESSPPSRADAHTIQDSSADGCESNDPGLTPGNEISLFDKLIATGLGSGFSPFAPGTAGSLVGLFVYWIPGFEKAYIILPSIVVFFFWGAHVSNKMEKVYGHDPSVANIDEVVSMWVSLAFLPKNLIVAILGFVIFRLFDIFKPFPASYIDKREGGFAIMSDDVICGIYTNIVLRLFIWFV
jgi:phosphatidylglycerophosphatase A